MNGKKMSGEITGKEISGRKAAGTNMDNAGEAMAAKSTIDENVTGNSMQAQELPPRRARQVESAMPGKKKLPIGWFLLLAGLGLFIGHFWSYIPSFHGIISLFVFSKFLAGLSGTHLLL